MVTVTTLSIATAGFILTITSRSRVAFHSASWQQAAAAAESAGNLALVEIRRIMPANGALPANAWSGWTIQTTANGPFVSATSLPLARVIPAGATLQFVPPALVHAGEGNTTQTASVLLDAPTGMLVGEQQWLRLRATGTALVPGQRQGSPDKLDNRLRRLALRRDSVVGAWVLKPQVSRTLELVVRPVLPFHAAVIAGDDIDVSDSRAVVDSFDSSNPLYSTSGEYDSSRRKSGGTVCTNSSSFAFAGNIYGDVGTNGANVQASSSLHGAIDNALYQPTPEIKAPQATSSLPLGGLISNITVAAGSVLNPAVRRFTAVTGDLRITGGSGPGAVEILVDGDVTGTIRVDNNVQAKIFIGGDVKLSAGDIDNASRRATNLQIYCLKPQTSQTRSVELNLSSDIYAAIYAPSHKVKLKGNGDLMGALVVKSLEADGKARIHFDEALTNRAGPVIDYKVASWIEDVR